MVAPLNPATAAVAVPAPAAPVRAPLAAAATVTVATVPLVRSLIRTVARSAPLVIALTLPVAGTVLALVAALLAVTLAALAATAAAVVALPLLILALPASIPSGALAPLLPAALLLARPGAGLILGFGGAPAEGGHAHCGRDGEFSKRHVIILAACVRAPNGCRGRPLQDKHCVQSS